MFIYLLCHLHALTDILGLHISGLTPCQQYLRYIKVAFHGIIFPNDLLGIGGKCAFGSMTFLTMTIKYQRDLLIHIWDIFCGEVFYNNSGAFIE